MLKFITGNKNKFFEVQKNLSPLEVAQVDIDLDEIQELDARKIIEHKLKQALQHEAGEFMVEDVSFTLDALNGQLPGPFIRWFNESIGPERLGEIARALGNTKAEVKVIIGYAKSPSEIKYFEARVGGEIVEPRGTGGFGFDIIFQPNGSAKTFAEDKGQNNYKTSARYMACEKLKNYLLE